MSEFYDLTQPGGPREISSLHPARHGFLKPGDHVTYADPKNGPCGIGDSEHVITALIGHRDPEMVTAVLDGGRWEVQADNLIRVNGRHRRD